MHSLPHFPAPPRAQVDVDPALCKAAYEEVVGGGGGSPPFPDYLAQSVAKTEAAVAARQRVTRSHWTVQCGALTDDGSVSVKVRQCSPTLTHTHQHHAMPRVQGLTASGAALDGTFAVATGALSVRYTLPGARFPVAVLVSASVRVGRDQTAAKGVYTTHCPASGVRVSRAWEAVRRR